MDPIRIPTEIDTPQQILLWSSDEIIPFLFFLFLGNFTHHLFLGLAVGTVIGHLYKRFKNTRPKGFLLHWFYWHGLGRPKGKTFMAPFKREFLP